MSFLSNVLLILTVLLKTTEAAKFSVQGPVLTVTLKDPQPSHPLEFDRDATVAEAFAATKQEESGNKWVDLSSLRPTLFWSLQCNSPPLPNWLPSWTSARTNVGYRYDELKRLPTFVEADLQFRSEKLNTELQVQPSYEVKNRRTNLLLQASHGASYFLARFSIQNSDRSSGQRVRYVDEDEDSEYASSSLVPKRSRGLEFLRASYNLAFPAGSSLGNIRITPSLDLTKQEPACVLEGTTGDRKSVV